MIPDLALRWFVTLLFTFSAAVCVSAIVRTRHSATNLISHSLHAVMAVAMAVMAWPRGAELPSRAPMIFFAAGAVWFIAMIPRNPGHRLATTYHALMMLAMAWMYAAMGGLSLRRAEEPAITAAGHAGHAGHGGHTGHSVGARAAEPVSVMGTLNVLCTIGFAAAAAFWFYRLVTARLQSSGDRSHSTIGILCQLAMAVGMAIMFGVML